MPTHGKCMFCGEMAYLNMITGYDRKRNRIVAVMVCGECEKAMKKLQEMRERCETGEPVKHPEVRG